MLSLTRFFSKMEDILQEEISFTIKMRFAQIQDNDSVLICDDSTFLQPLSFFIENSKDLDFIQLSEFVKLDDIDIEKPFFAVTKFTSTNAVTKLKEFYVYYYNQEV